MRKQSYKFKESSFLGIPKDISLIVQRMLSNQDLLKLLEYNVKDWKNQPNVTEDQVERMFDTEQISAVPRLRIESERKTYIRISLGTTVPNQTNPEFRDNTFGIDIICHYDDWNLGNFETRPQRIAGEIDAMLDKTHLTGIGVLNFISAAPVIYNNEYAGISLTYLTIRGNDDKLTADQDREYQSSFDDWDRHSDS